MIVAAALIGIVVLSTHQDDQPDVASRIQSSVTKGSQAEGKGNWAEMEEHYLAALDLRAKVAQGDVLRSSLLGYAARGLAAHYLEQNRFSESLDLISSSLDGLPSMGPGYKAALYTVRGQILVALGLPDLADQPLEEALRLARISAESKNPNVGAFNNAVLDFARLKIAAGQFHDALEILDEGIARTPSFEWKAGPERTARNLGSFNLQRGIALMHLGFDQSGEFEEARETQEAEEAFRSCLENDLLRPEDRFETRWRLALLYLFREERVPAERELEALAKDQEDGRIGTLDPWERFVYRAIESRIRTDSPASSRRETLLASFEELIGTWQAVKRPGGIGVFRFRELRLGAEELLSLSADWEKIEVLLLAQRISSLEVAKPKCSVADVRALVKGAGRGCLVFVPGLDRGHVIAFDSDRIVSAPLLPCVDLKWKVRRYVAEISQPPEGLSRGRRKRRDAQIAELEADLAGRLFPPPIRAVVEQWTDVLVVGRDLLRGLPFECLPVFEGRPFGMTHAVTDLPSFAAGVALSRREPAPIEAGFLLVSDPTPPRHVVVGHPQVGRLHLDDATYAELERNAKRGLTVVKAEHASLDGLRDGLREVRGLLHILAHGILDYEAEVRPRIALAADSGHPSGLLSASEIRELPVPRRVILSVCRSGSGAERVGDSGSSNLGGALLDAGARTVILSSSDVTVASALTMSGYIYAGLAAGSSMAAALRDARRELARSESFGDPYYWGLTYAFGLDD